MEAVKDLVVLAVLFVSLCLFGVCHSEVVVHDHATNETASYDGWPASFGDFSKEANGWLREATPHNGCSSITPVPKSPDGSHRWIALILRGSCNFDQKILNAQIANYRGVIMVNYAGERLFNMGGGRDASLVDIPSVMVSHNTGNALRSSVLYKVNRNMTVSINDYYIPFIWHIYLYPFAIVVAICLFLLTIFMCIRYHRERREEQRRRLPPVNLRRLPTMKFKKGQDSYETCAICLEDYSDGEKLRILPCEHAYHCRCVDKWLTSRSRTCPVCKFSITDDGGEAGGVMARLTRRRGRLAQASAAANDVSSDEGGANESAPLVTQLSSTSGGGYGAHASASTTSVPLTAMRAQAADGLRANDSPLDRRGCVVRIQPDSEPPSRAQLSSSV